MDLLISEEKHFSFMGDFCWLLFRGEKITSTEPVVITTYYCVLFSRNFENFQSQSQNVVLFRLLSCVTVQKTFLF